MIEFTQFLKFRETKFHEKYKIKNIFDPYFYFFYQILVMNSSRSYKFNTVFYHHKVYKIINSHNF